MSIRLNGSTSGYTEIDAPAVAGSNTLVLPGGNGTNGQVLSTNGSGALSWVDRFSAAGPAFSAYRATTDQSVASNTYVKAQLNAEDFDTANCFDSTTNYRFTPNVAGYYLVTGSIRPDSTSVFGNGVLSIIYKNGSAYRRGTSYNVNAVDTVASVPTVTALIYLNGSTDYVELYGFCVGGTGMQFGIGDNSTSFSGFLARPA